MGAGQRERRGYKGRGYGGRGHKKCGGSVGVYGGKGGADGVYGRQGWGSRVGCGAVNGGWRLWGVGMGRGELWGAGAGGCRGAGMGEGQPPSPSPFSSLSQWLQLRALQAVGLHTNPPLWVWWGGGGGHKATVMGPGIWGGGLPAPSALGAALSPRPSVPVSPPDTVCPTGPGGDGSQWGPHGVGWRNAAPWGNGAHLGQRAQLQRAALWGWQWGWDAGGAPPPSSPINNAGCDPKGWRWGGGKPQPLLLPEGPISLCPHISMSPYLCVPTSPCPHISVSPYLCVPAFPSPHVPSCPGFPPPHVPHIILHWDLCAPCAPHSPTSPILCFPPFPDPLCLPPLDFPILPLPTTPPTAPHCQLRALGCRAQRWHCQAMGLEVSLRFPLPPFAPHPPH